MARSKKPFEAVQFTRESAERIASRVRVAELTPLPASPLVFDGVLTQSPPPKVFRMGLFNGDWPKGTAKTVTLRNATTGTVSATNLLWPVPDGPERNCAIAKEGTAWYLLQPETYLVNGFTAATLTTSALTFYAVPMAALATAGTHVVHISITTCSTAAA